MLAGKATLKADVEVGGDASVTGDVIAGGRVSLTGGISVGGNAIMKQNASIAGRATLTGDLSVGGEATVTGDVAVSGRISGNGSGIASLNARALTGTIPPDRISGAFARRDKFNIFGKNQQFQGAVRFNGRLSANAAGRATVPVGEDHIEVTLPSGVTAGSASLVIATPQSDLKGATFFAKVFTGTSIRIVLSQNAADPVTFGWLVLN